MYDILVSTNIPSVIKNGLIKYVTVSAKTRKACALVKTKFNNVHHQTICKSFLSYFSKKQDSNRLCD